MFTNITLNLIDFHTKGTVHINAAHNWQYGFQTPYSSLAEGIIHFHDDLVIFLTFILFFVLYILYSCFSYFNKENIQSKKNHYAAFIHHPSLEIIWTILPAVILIIIAIPSFSLLYSVDEFVDPLFTVKVVGHQWYWSYELMSPSELTESFFGETSEESIISETSIDSYLLRDEDLDSFDALSHLRLLSVDNHLIIPTETHTRITVTAADVLHSWAIPSLGVKLDACPGRLNQTSLYIERPGLYYGQCSEICGVNHGFMPIGIVSSELFKSSDIRILMDIDPFLLAIENLDEIIGYKFCL